MAQKRGREWQREEIPASAERRKKKRRAMNIFPDVGAFESEPEMEHTEDGGQSDMGAL